MGPPDERRRPREAASGISTTKIRATLPDVEAAELALRIAWLRVHADQLRSFDRSGQLSAQLLDFADLLEVAQERDWFR